MDGVELTASEGESYHWFLDDNITLRANSQTYTAEESGSYHVHLVDENGCSDVSEPVIVEVTGIEELGLSVSMNAYPNPTSGMFLIEISGHGQGLFEYQLNNIYGKLIQKGTFNKVPGSASLELKISGDPGVYFLRVSNGYSSGIIKIIRN